MGKRENRDNSKKRSIFGIVSLLVGCINFGVIFFNTYRFGVWLIENEVYNNPSLLEGKRIPDNIESMIGILVVMLAVGVLLGILGLLERKRKLAPIIGTILNGVLLLICILKL